MLVARLILAVAALMAVIVPSWWAAGQLERRVTPFFRLLLAVGLGLVGYLSVVNLLGRALHQSTIPAAAFLVCCGAGTVWLSFRRRDELAIASLWTSRREWLGIVALAVVIGLPQMILAVSTPFWDEVASSAIHLTAANQFAEGVFPPRHNAFPDIAVKYHYGFAILSGTVHWLTGLSANVSVDVVSTVLWLFTFLFVFNWLRELGFSRAPSVWGATTTLLGGGFAWLFFRRVEAYSGFEVSPPPTELLHRYSDTASVVSNLLGSAQVPSAHLRNPDGTLSSLPWDIAAQFQQHPVSLGIALCVFALYVFVQWQRRAQHRAAYAVITVATFAVLFLAHAVFGGVATVTAGLVLLGSWVRAPTRQRFTDGLVFGAGVAIVAVLHGGFLTFGRQYGASSDVLTLRRQFGFSRGGLPGFVLWNVVGFGIPLLLALVALISRPLSSRKHDDTARLTFAVLTVFAAFSYLLPQFAFYSSETSGVEEFTEITKFFFTAHLGFALLSVWGLEQLSARVRRVVFVPGLLAMAVTPLLFIAASATTTVPTGQRHWVGLYVSPYHPHSVEQQMGERLALLKRSNRETYFDASADERVHGYLSEMLVFGGSVFTLTPSRYERTGVGYRLSQDVVAARLVQNGRMAQLRPGAAESCDCRWFYARPERDMAFVPPFVRARFDKLVAESAFVSTLAGAGRVLYRIEKPTVDVDAGIERYWRPRVVMQTSTDIDGDGRDDLIFYDYFANQVLVGDRAIPGPPFLKTELAQLWVGRSAGARRASLLFGRARDTEFRLGRRIEDLVEQSEWGWSEFRGDHWSEETSRWSWNGDIPLIARTDRAGAESQLMYRAATGEWYQAANVKIPGPSLPASDLPIPFAGRFIRGSVADLAVRSRANGMIAIQSLSHGTRLGFTWGLGPNEVLVPGDYNGDGYDEIGIWNENNLFWYWRSVPDGPITQFQFGVPGAVPVPYDYNHDGRLDPAYWMPAERKIYVTFSNGRSIDRVVAVPPHSIPAYVNVY